MIDQLPDIKRDSSMGNLDGFRSRINDLISCLDRKDEEQKKVLEGEMHNQIARQEDVDCISSEVFLYTIEPRLKLLAELFDDAKYCKDDRGYFGRVTFNLGHHYRGSFAFEVGLFADVKSNELYVKCELGVVPVFFSFEKGDTKSYPVAELDLNEITEFVEHAVENAVLAYSKYTKCEQYFIPELNHKDPVCGMMVNEHANPQTLTNGGKTYYFCSSSCSRRFQEAPLQYADATETAAPTAGIPESLEVIHIK